MHGVSMGLLGRSSYHYYRGRYRSKREGTETGLVLWMGGC